MYSTANSTALAEEGGGPHRRAPSTMDGEYLALDMGSNNAQSDQQMRLLEQQVRFFPSLFPLSCMLCLYTLVSASEKTCRFKTQCAC